MNFGYFWNWTYYLVIGEGVILVVFVTLDFEEGSLNLKSCIFKFKFSKNDLKLVHQIWKLSPEKHQNQKYKKPLSHILATNFVQLLNSPYDPMVGEVFIFALFNF